MNPVLWRKVVFWFIRRNVTSESTKVFLKQIFIRLYFCPELYSIFFKIIWKFNEQIFSADSTKRRCLEVHNFILKFTTVPEQQKMSQNIKNVPKQQKTFQNHKKVYKTTENVPKNKKVQKQQKTSQNHKKVHKTTEKWRNFHQFH